MTKRSLAVLAAGLLLLPCLARTSRGQTTAELTTKPWQGGQFGETLDKLLYEEQGHVKGENDRGEQLFWWDSKGRFRFSTTDPDAFSLAYRYLTMNFDTNSKSVPDTLDDMSLAAGIHLGDFGDGNAWHASAVLGLGYASDNLFADVNGLYGIGHLLFERRIGDADSLVLGIMYNGNSGLLPDVPLPEFAFTHRTPELTYSIGFPQSSLRWLIQDNLALSLGYMMPYTGDVRLEYTMGNGFSVFGDFANAFDGFYLDGHGREDRLFFEMRRAEVGVRYQNPDVYKGIGLDVALTAGYAWDQQLTRGFDVRDRDVQAELSDEPYIGLVLVGTF
jgi:hypothetical protein